MFDKAYSRYSFSCLSLPARRVAAACLALCFLLSAGFSHAAEVEAIVSAMQQRYETLKSFSASFEQEMTNAASGETEKRVGVISFRHPGLVRWETKKPENELLVVGEAEVWDYFPDEQAAYKYTVDDVLTSKTVLRFLSGRARLDQDFWVTSMGRDQSWEKLELVPKEAETEMVQAYLWLDPEHALLQKVQVIDFFGNENTVALSGVVLNPDLSDSQFAFTPPPGVDVFDNSSKK